MMGSDAKAAVPSPDDRRFKDAAWEENQLFDFIKQSYLLTARWLTQTVREVDGLDEKTAKKVDFYTRQFVDAMAPTNFLLTNPEVLRATVESHGENLVKGLQNLLEDLDRGKGKLRIKMTDLEAFRIGENIAVSPGKVVFRNDLIELLQYAPTTEKVYKRPLLIIPPWINKFYILDLREKNSFIKWAVGEGHTVFVVSWVNPDETLAAKSFEDYMLEGPVAALEAMEKATGEPDANVIGYCLGGTLLACTLAYMAAKKDSRVVSATFFASLVDFKEPGELGIFIDEEQLAALEERMNEKGYLEGTTMATTFNMLRANDLIWSFVVNNYLLGKDPFPFDLLYWNSDSTRMPAAMHSFYLRNMYQANKLVQPGRHHARGHADRSAQDQDSRLHHLHSRGPHRTLACYLCGDPALSGPGALRARRVRSHCRHRQSAGGQQVQLLDERQMPTRAAGLAGVGEGKPWLLVARLGPVDRQIRRRQGRRPQARRRQAQGDRGCAGLLREGQDSVGAPRY